MYIVIHAKKSQWRCSMKNVSTNDWPVLAPRDKRLLSDWPCSSSSLAATTSNRCWSLPAIMTKLVCRSSLTDPSWFRMTPPLVWATDTVCMWTRTMGSSTCSGVHTNSILFLDRYMRLGFPECTADACYEHARGGLEVDSDLARSKPVPLKTTESFVVRSVQKPRSSMQMDRLDHHSVCQLQD